MNKERPIIFNGAMVRAILGDRKWQTRRVVKITHKTPGLAACLEPPEWAEPRPKVAAELCPYGQPGDRLYVKETWKYYDWSEYGDPFIRYAADDSVVKWNAPDHIDEEWAERLQDIWAELSLPDNYVIDNRAADRKWRSPRFMPKWASRITLEVTGIRVERVQDISRDDCRAEGVGLPPSPGDTKFYPGMDELLSQFAGLWDSINAKRGYGWDVNPWVWVIEFRKVAQ